MVEVQEVRGAGVVRCWKDDEGWGVVDGEAVPGGCWVHFSALEMGGFRSARAGDRVEVEAERVEQDGLPWQAVRVRRLD